MHTKNVSGVGRLTALSGIRMATFTLISWTLLVAFATTTRPNILLMIADDLGIGDIGCFGNTSLKTPNIDRLSVEGAKLTHHLAAASLCTPSRAAFLTGRYAIRSGMASSLERRAFAYVASSAGLPPNETTFAELAKNAGYITALIGKWHLGLSEKRLGDYKHHPKRQGFDYFYGLPHTNEKDFGVEGDRMTLSQQPYWHYKLSTITLASVLAVTFLYKTGYAGLRLSICLTLVAVFSTGIAYFVDENKKILNGVIMRNFEIVEQPIDLRTLSAKLVFEGREFLTARQVDAKPFLLLVSWSLPHTYLPSVDRFSGKSKHGKYGDAIEELDWSIGEILNTLDRLGLGDNTFVYFTSDHGGHIEEKNIRGEVEGGYNGIYKGGKSHGAPEGAIRVPAVIRWPTHVTPASTISEPTSLMDILPTVASMVGIPYPEDRTIDGKTLLPLLKGQTSISPHQFMFHYCGSDIHAVRYRPREGSTVWKLVLKEPNYLPGQQACAFMCGCSDAIDVTPPHLFDITSDPNERNPRDASKYPDVYQFMMEALKTHKKSVISVPDQFTVSRLIWWPWLQPCCSNNFPFCSCQDKKFTDIF